MIFSQRAISEFKRILKKLEDDTFDEDDILNLLLQIRAVSQKKDLIWEFASFIAHPEERNQGIFQNLLNVNYAKIKLQNEKGNGKNFNPYKIEKKLFKVLIIEGLKLTPDIVIKEKTGFSKSECEKRINDSYFESDNYFEIKNAMKLNDTWHLINPIINIIRLDPVFENTLILKEFKVAFKKISEKLNLNFDYNKFLHEKSDSLLFCLMCLIHSSNFKFYDNKTGSCNLNISNDFNRKRISLHLMADIKSEENFTIALNWSLMKIENAEQFLPDLNDVKGVFYEDYKFDKFNAVRDNNNNLIIGNK